MIYWSSFAAEQHHLLLDHQVQLELAGIQTDWYKKHHKLFGLISYCITSVAASFLMETVEPEIDLSDALLDLDLREDLLELFFGVWVEAMTPRPAG